MDRSPLCLALVGSVIMLTASLSGCIGIWNQRPPCPECGCHTTIDLSPGATAILTLTGDEMDYKDVYKTTDFELKYMDEGEQKGLWLFSFESEEPNSNSTFVQLNYKIEVVKRVDSRLYRERLGAWNNFSYELDALSSDDHVSSKKFFNGTNSIDGNIMIDNRDEVNMTLDREYPGVELYLSGHRHDESVLKVDSDWAFEISIHVGTLCVD